MLHEIIFLAVNATTTTFRVEDLVTLITTNPKLAIAVIVQIIMGLALGYIMAKVAKYVLAFIGVLVVGAVLNVWSLGGSVEEVLARFGAEAMRLKDMFMSFLTTLGILTVGPVSLGFVIGLIIGLVKK